MLYVGMDLSRKRLDFEETPGSAARRDWRAALLRRHAHLTARPRRGRRPRPDSQRPCGGVQRARQLACELSEQIVVDGATRVDHIAGFYRVQSARVTTAKIYREGSAEP